MINRLLGDWHSRLKYVDDTTVFEVIPRNPNETPVYRKPNRRKNFIMLGVIINENLTWNCHVAYITAKASKNFTLSDY